MQQKLKYLFTAEYKDGSTFDQHPEDISKTKEGGSSFSDVDLANLVKFYLVSGTVFYSVDLRTGCFEINGIPFILYDLPVENRRLIFFRKHRHEFTSNGKDKPEEKSHIITYRLGWQANDADGKNIERVIEFP